MALIVTVGGETSDSYVSVSESDKYFQAHYNLTKSASWAALAQPRKEFALKRACQQIETLKCLDAEYTTGSLPLELILNYHYDVTIHKLEYRQRLQFPRNLDISSTGVGFIPQEIKDAQCEQAVHMLSFDDSNLTALNQGVVIEANSAGPVKTFVKYSEGVTPSYLSPLVTELLRPFLRYSSHLRRA